MMLEDILRLPEGKTLEFKRDLSSPKPALSTLVAFANSAGGRLIIGVEDGNKKVVGVERPLDLERRIANLIADSIQPTLLAEIEILPWRRLYVLVVQVHPSPLRPHHLKSEGIERSTYVRLTRLPCNFIGYPWRHVRDHVISGEGNSTHTALSCSFCRPPWHYRCCAPEPDRPNRIPWTPRSSAMLSRLRAR